ncbi:hypothetical protein DRJ22_02560 [Candidatus Woesearchaeota archaeon]|nr:MAG: hypothetical protein DRJ22_02560 [Candidatus Woesearchaeota archaeon]
MRENFFGEIVVASVVRVLDVEGSDLYNLIVSVETGSKQGEECFAAYKAGRNLLSLFDEYILVRLDRPFISKSEKNFREQSFAAYFISSVVPEKFEFSLSENTVLYAPWTKDMAEVSVKPVVGGFSDFYNPGWVKESLHLFNGSESGIYGDFFLQFNFKEKPKFLERLHSGIAEVVGSYLDLMKSRGVAPRIVTFDENIDFDRTILSNFFNNDFYFIEMEPQK